MPDCGNQQIQLVLADGRKRCKRSFQVWNNTIEYQTYGKGRRKMLENIGDSHTALRTVYENSYLYNMGRQEATRVLVRNRLST